MPKRLAVNFTWFDAKKLALSFQSEAKWEKWEANSRKGVFPADTFRVLFFASRKRKASECSRRAYLGVVDYLGLVQWRLAVGVLESLLRGVLV